MTQQHKLMGILVVEDDAALRINILNYLICAGYTVKGVCSAIEFYREFLMAPYAISIIDTDLYDQEGLVVAEYARKNTDMGIITLSEPLSSSTVPSSFNSGADFNLFKPVQLRQLLSCVGTLFSRFDAVHESM